MAENHVVVIGAGIVGLCTAAYLLRRGHRVTVIDRRGPGEMTSFGNAGGLSASATPMAMPGIVRNVPKWLMASDGPLHIRPGYALRALPWLLRFVAQSRLSHARRNSHALYSLNSRSIGDLRPLLQWASLENLVVTPANMTLFRTRAQYDASRLTHELREATGHPYELLDGETIRAMEPHLTADYNLALRAPDAGYCRDPYDLSRGLAQTLFAAGCAYLRADVTGFDLVDGRIRAVKTDRSAIAASHVVVAAGIWSKVLVERLGHFVPLESQRGYHVSVKSPNVTLNSLIAVSDRKVSVTPMSSGLRISGTVEFSGTSALPNYDRAAMLLPILKALMPTLRIDEISEWAGHRPCTPDSLPVIGRSSKVANAYFGFGHGHQGLMGAGPTGRALSDLVGGGAPPIDLSPFSIERF